MFVLPRTSPELFYLNSKFKFDAFIRTSETIILGSFHMIHFLCRHEKSTGATKYCCFHTCFPTYNMYDHRIYHNLIYYLWKIFINIYFANQYNINMDTYEEMVLVNCAERVLRKIRTRTRSKNPRYWAHPLNSIRLTPGQIHTIYKRFKNWPWRVFWLPQDVNQYAWRDIRYLRTTTSQVNTQIFQPRDDNNQ